MIGDDQQNLIRLLKYTFTKRASIVGKHYELMMNVDKTMTKPLNPAEIVEELTYFEWTLNDLWLDSKKWMIFF